MLQTIRDKITGWFATVFLGAIAIVFIFWGINLRSVTTPTYAAKVNGERIPLETARRAWQEQQARLQQMMRSEIPDAFKKQQQDALLDGLIRHTLLAERAHDLGYRASDKAIAETIMTAPELQVDGKFSRERYAAFLRERGRSETQLEAELRTNLETGQLQAGVLSSAFVTPAELVRRQALEGEQRDIDYAIIPANALIGTVNVPDADVQAWYDAHKANYMTAETADVQYIELKLADVEKDVAVNEDALKAHYEQIKDQFTTQERRHVQHILIAAGEGTDDAAAEKQAEDVLAKVKAGGDFAALAKQYSKDPGSAAKGGDLGWAAKGMFVAPFEQALFSMSVGEVKGPIKTQFGYHILKLAEIEPGRIKTFEEVRPQLEADYKREQAQSIFYDRTQKLADESFAHLTELDSVAKTLGVQLKDQKGFTRQGGGDLGTDQQIVDAVFSEPVLEKGQNSALITIGDDRALVVRVTDHKMPEQKPLDAVRADITTELKQRAEKEAVAKKGAEQLAKLNAGTAWSTVLGEIKVTASGKQSVARDATGVPAPVMRTAFNVPKASVTPDKPQYRGVATDDGGYALIAVSAVRKGDAAQMPEGERDVKAQQSARAVGTAEFSAYIEDLERRAKIERNPAVFE